MTMIIHKPAVAYTNPEPILSKIIQSQNKHCQYNFTFQNVPSISPYPFLLKILFFFLQKDQVLKAVLYQMEFKEKNLYSNKCFKVKFNDLKISELFWRGSPLIFHNFYLFYIQVIYNLSIYKFAEICLNLEPKLIFKAPNVVAFNL